MENKRTLFPIESLHITVSGEGGGTGGGRDGFSPIIEVSENTSDSYKLEITTASASFETPNLKGNKGDDGADGIDGVDGVDGVDGEDGFSPVIVESTDNTEDNYKLDITDKNHSFTTPNLKGKQGVQGIQGIKGDKGDKGDIGLTGAKGADGVSPVLSENADNSDVVFKLDITDVNGVYTTPNLIGRQGVQGIKGDKGEQGEQGVQGIQGIKGDKGDDGYPFLIYREYNSLDDFDPAHFPEIGLMFMIKSDELINFPVYRYTGSAETPYSYVTELATSEGLKGEKGDKGDTGEQGIQGEKGADGITYTPAIGTVETVGSTSDATVEIVVDNETKTATFNFAIPKGANGAIGGKGDKGDKGDTGEQGADGEDGTTYVPSIGTVTTVSSVEEATASVELDEETKQAEFSFSIPKGADGERAVQFIPVITENNELAWENDGGLGNPPTVPIQQIYSNAVIGTVLSFAGQTAPHGYLLCDGASYPTADYPDLYAVIGNTYGGDSTNFNVPDYREVVLVGAGKNTTDTIADHDVYELGEFKDDQMQTHTHDVIIPNHVGGSWQVSTTAKAYYSTQTITQTSTASGKGTTTHGKQKGVTYIIKAFHTNEGVDSGVSDDVIDYVDNKINDASTNTTSTWSSNKIAQQINNATAIKYDNVINPNATTDTGWSLAQGESHFYSRLLQLDGHLGSKSSTFSFLLFVKANYDNPTTIYATQLAGMDDDRSNITYAMYFELGVSSSGNLTITNKSAVTASYRFI